MLQILQFSNCSSISSIFLFTCRTEKEQQLSAEWSSLVNKAYKVLMSPIQRAEYLLRIHDVDISETNTISNKAFLMEMMERNEEVNLIISFYMCEIDRLWPKKQKCFTFVDQMGPKIACFSNHLWNLVICPVFGHIFRKFPNLSDFASIFCTVRGPLGGKKRVINICRTKWTKIASLHYLISSIFL